MLVAATAPSVARADDLAEGRAELLVLDDEWLTGLSEPTALAFLPDGRAVISERVGALKVRALDGTVTTAGTVPADASHGERGFLNVLPHPAFAQNHLLYFYYSANEEAGGVAEDRHRVVTMELGDDGLLVPGSERILVRGLRGPANHNGGGLAVLGDYLYIGTGDTGNNSNSPPGENISNYYATCFTNAQGKLLRVHLDGTIPDDNPLLGQTVSACGAGPAEVPVATSTEARPEIFAWGFRNAFRVWADPVTGSLWVGDVGEISYEMIHRVPPAGALHFGWPFREGNLGLDRSSCEQVTPNVGSCTDAQYVCPHGAGGCNAIAGGRILDDCRWPAELRGRYVFGDYSSQGVWTLPLDEARTTVVGEREPLVSVSGGGPVSFAEYDGALYVVVFGGNGHVARIAPATAPDATCVVTNDDLDAGAAPLPDASVAVDAGVGSSSPDDDSADDDSPADDADDSPNAPLRDGGSAPLPSADAGAASPDGQDASTPLSGEEEGRDASVSEPEPATEGPGRPRPNRDGGPRGPSRPRPGDADGGSVEPPSSEAGAHSDVTASGDEGCDCRVGWAPRGANGAALWAALVGFAVWRRRRGLARTSVRL